MKTDPARRCGSSLCSVAVIGEPPHREQRTFADALGINADDDDAIEKYFQRHVTKPISEVEAMLVDRGITGEDADRFRRVFYPHATSREEVRSSLRQPFPDHLVATGRDSFFQSTPEPFVPSPFSTASGDNSPVPPQTSRHVSQGSPPMSEPSIRMPVGKKVEVVSESMIREAHREFLEGRLSDQCKRLIDAILSFMCVSVLRLSEQPNG